MSLPFPVKSLSFAVTGKSLQLQLPRPLTPLPTRKIYNPKYFFNETYQHEIANHYRDYKRRTLRLPPPRYRRRRRSTLYVPYIRAAFYGVVSGELRPVLPMTVHNFPRFAAVYTKTSPCGRQTLCEDEPPDITYNATVRRIQQANNYKEFKLLVDRQLRLSSKRTKSVSTKYYNNNKAEQSKSGAEGKEFCKRKAKGWARAVIVGGSTKCEKSTKTNKINNNGADVNLCQKWWADDDNDDDTNNDDDYASHTNANDSERKVKATAQQRRQKQQQQQQQQGKHKFNETTFKAIQGTRTGIRQPTQDCRLELSTSGHKVKPQIIGGGDKQKIFFSKNKIERNSLEYFLQLACEYYEQGFLQNIKYLQAIGARNATRRTQLKLVAQAARARPSQAATSSSSNDESSAVTATATASAATSATNTPSSTPRKAAENFVSLTSLLRRIGRKRSFRVGSSSRNSREQFKGATLAEAREERTQQNPCAIRVNIKPYADQVLKAVRLKREGVISSGVDTAHAATQSSSTTRPWTKQQTSEAQCNATEFYGCASSMNDYLNANFPTTISTATTGTKSATTNTHTQPEAAAGNFHDLIDHLMQLEISDINASLPKITLTDCSTSINNGALADEIAVANTVNTNTDIATTTTQTQANDNAFAFEYITNSSNNFSAYNSLETQVNQQEEQYRHHQRQQQQRQRQQQQQQQQVPISTRRNAFTLREAKFGSLHTSLEIPDEVYYNSEARPP